LTDFQDIFIFSRSYLRAAYKIKDKFDGLLYKLHATSLTNITFPTWSHSEEQGAYLLPTVLLFKNGGGVLRTTFANFKNSTL
jgi:hypothetical protein